MLVPDDLIMETITEVVEKFLKPKFIELGMNASGQWLRALKVKTSINRGEIWGMNYSYWLSEGRGPNKNQSPESIGNFVRWAGSTFIKQWCIDKGINPDLSYAISHKIAKEGTSYYPNGTDVLNILNSSEVQDFVKTKIGDYLLEQTRLTILEMFKKAVT